MGKLTLAPFLMDDAILAALREDINDEDISTNAVVDSRATGSVQLFAKSDGILAGAPVFARTFTLFDPETTVAWFFEDGDALVKGDCVATITGPLRALLSAERVALNFLQRMSGIATYTHKMVQALEGSATKIVDTRKTTPNFRLFAKYAVRAGGGENHRFNLTDGVMLKDNHCSAAGSIANAVERARAYASFVRKIEVEVETITMVKEALDAGADIIMLDNMNVDEIKEAVEFIDGRALVELSGNIDLNNISKYKDLGADIISSGALTHSAPALDFSMKGLTPDASR
ncbi:MAG: carboxylating nicotinate-nucleotide diphosphorylase [Peptoniphilus sp.]|nr:carboxylating nicotinate-nucleotide diphosphorylase [Peptoniphilus sp.]MDY3118711.1 carboxylating nicotinate-nucleotide diphosphorylase [Peptoniphilus sp.]